MAKLYKIREQDLDEELLKRLFSSGNTSIDLETILSDYVKKSEGLTADDLDPDFLEELRKELSGAEIDLSIYREKSVLIGIDDLSSEVIGLLNDLQKQLEGITGTSDLENISEQLRKLQTELDNCKMVIENNKALAEQYTDDKIAIVTEDLASASRRISVLETKINEEVRLKTELIAEEDLEEALFNKINEAYSKANRIINEIDFEGTANKFITANSSKRLMSSEFLIPGIFIEDESIINILLENKTTRVFFDIQNEVKYELNERKVENTTTDPETGEETTSITTELYYEIIENALGPNSEYRYRLLFDQYTGSLYYLGETRLYTIFKKGDSEIEDDNEETVNTTVTKVSFKETSVDWNEEYIDSDTINYSITFDKPVTDTIISDVFMLDGTSYRNCMVDIYVTDTTITIKAIAPFTGYFLMDTVEVASQDIIDDTAERLDEINGEVV